MYALGVAGRGRGRRGRRQNPVNRESKLPSGILTMTKQDLENLQISLRLKADYI